LIIFSSIIGTRNKVQANTLVGEGPPMPHDYFETITRTNTPMPQDYFETITRTNTPMPQFPINMFHGECPQQLQ
jgi:phage terminase large subunit-like protein